MIWRNPKYPKMIPWNNAVIATKLLLLRFVSNGNRQKNNISLLMGIVGNAIVSN